jgi:hypothetical protein
MRKGTPIRALLILTLVWRTACAELLPWALRPPHAGTGKVRILDAVEARFPERQGIPFTELSGLAYNGITKRLYAVSDQGYLYTMRLETEGERIVGLDLLDARRLRDGRGRPLTGDEADAEGLEAIPDGLLVSFERRPRIALYRTDGTLRETVPLPKALRKTKRYRGRNRMLESVAWSPCHGMVTAPERPLEGKPESEHVLYGEDGERWTMPASGSLTGMTFTADGKLLVLERKFDRLTRRRETVLGRLDPGSGRMEPLLRMRSESGWNLDNFEGLTRLDGDRYLMVSDDNGMPWQHTVFVLFEIRE